MKKDNPNLSRRKFLAAGSAAAASSVLLANKDIPAAEAVSNNLSENLKDTGNKPMTSTAEYLDVTDIPNYPVVNGDITNALNRAIILLNQSNGRGGKIFIPSGVWTSYGGHELDDSITIEGVGFTIGNSNNGTVIKLNNSSNPSNHMFLIGKKAGDTGADRRNCSIKNLAIDMSNNASSGAGILFANQYFTDSQGRYRLGVVYATHLENVGFFSGQYGIKVESPTGTSFECILNRFDRVALIGCRYGFWCNTNNGGYEFNSPYISIPASTTRTNPAYGFYCYLMGTLTVNNYLCVGNLSPQPTGSFPEDGSTLLHTFGGWNNITFQNGGQDENIDYLYTSRDDGNNFPIRPIVFRNCTIQSKVQIYSNTSFVSDSNTIVNFASSSDTKYRTFYDSPGYFLKVYMMGKNGVDSRVRTGTGAPQLGSEILEYFQFTPYSQIKDPFNAPLGY